MGDKSINCQIETDDGIHRQRADQKTLFSNHPAEIHAGKMF